MPQDPDSSSANDIVARQYEAWVYPEPIADLTKAIEDGYGGLTDIPVFGPLYWPDRRFFDKLDVLVAGCGTNEGAYHAIRNPRCRITAIDVSRASLGHTKYLKEKHRLDNLEIHLLDLHEVGRLGKQFDLIISTGVLHHLADPDAGLRSLRDVLAPDGVMSLMLYGKTRRHGVYLLQRAFQLMGLGQTKVDIDIVRRLLDGIPKNHSVNAYLESANDLAFDAGVVDTFLHPQDRAYAVGEVYDFVETNGLSFMGWLDRAPYCPRAVISSGEDILSRICRLPEREQAEITDLLSFGSGTHRFNACLPAHFTRAPRITFNSENFLRYRPAPRFGLRVAQRSDLASGRPAILERNGYKVTATLQEGMLLEQCNGQRRISDILPVLDRFVSLEDDKVAIARRLFAAMHEMGHFLFSTW